MRTLVSFGVRTSNFFRLPRCQERAEDGTVHVVERLDGIFRKLLGRLRASTVFLCSLGRCTLFGLADF